MFAQQRHLRTGEEFQIVGDNTPFMSSSMEMASFITSFDVTAELHDGFAFGRTRLGKRVGGVSDMMMMEVGNRAEGEL